MDPFSKEVWSYGIVWSKFNSHKAENTRYGQERKLTQQSTIYIYNGGCSSVNAKPTAQAPTSPGVPRRQYLPTSLWDLNYILSYLISAIAADTA
jgi:hypothetical protein